SVLIFEEPFSRNRVSSQHFVVHELVGCICPLRVGNSASSVRDQDIIRLVVIYSNVLLAILEWSSIFSLYLLHTSAKKIFCNFVCWYVVDSFPHIIAVSFCLVRLD